MDSLSGSLREEDQTVSKIDRVCQENVTLARIAALMQVLAPEPPDVRLGLVKYLSGVAHVEATRALARLAIFSAEDEVRQAAVEALKVRRERDYTDILLQGLRYPWPAVARRAADAAVKLERTDLVPQLVGLLEEPDPRPRWSRRSTTKRCRWCASWSASTTTADCLLCHAPGNTDRRVAGCADGRRCPVPGEPLPSAFRGLLATTSPDLLVRVDVTYLRQDFSVLQPVADANPWPEMQRFDFLVRTRELTEEEAAALPRQAGPARARPALAVPAAPPWPRCAS